MEIPEIKQKLNILSVAAHYGCQPTPVGANLQFVLLLVCHYEKGVIPVFSE